MASSEPKDEIEENVPENIGVEEVRISPNQIFHGVYQQEQNINRRTSRTSPTASEVNFSL